MSAEASRWSESGAGLAVGAAIGLMAKDLDLPSLLSWWGSRAPLIPLLALAGAVAWRTRLRALFGGTALVLGVAWIAVAYTPLTRVLARDLARRDSVAPADAVFVLGSRVQRDGELSTVAMSRLLHGLELLAEGWAPRLILSELPPPQPRYTPAAKELMRRLGLGQEVLTVEPVRSTRDEALAVAALFRERGFTRLLLVTSPSHSRRASAALEHEGIVVISSPSTETQFDLEMLEYPDDRIRAVGSLLHERVGLWLYRWRGWID